MDPVDTLINRLGSLDIPCDRNLAQEFLAIPGNRKVIETEFLPILFHGFLREKELAGRAKKAEEENKELAGRAKKAEEEMKKTEEENKELAALVAQAEISSFLDRKFPPMLRGSGCSTSSLADTSHLDAKLTVVPETFGLLADDQLPLGNKVPSYLKCKISKRTQTLVYSTEASIVSIVKVVLEEALDWLGLDLQCQQEYGLAAVRPDLVVILGLHGLPVGAVEVKLPNKDLTKDQEDPMNAGRLHGQLLDYLLILKHVYGVDDPLGIACTYHSWRFCWLPGSEDFVKRTERVEAPTPELLAARVSGLSLVADRNQGPGEKLEAVPVLGIQASSTSSKPSSEVRQRNRDTSQIPRELFGTRVLAYDDPALPRHIVSFLHKLTSTSVSPRKIMTGHFYPHLKDDQFDWDELEVEPNPSIFPASQTKYFWLLRELGAGQEGKAWEATTRTGATCAVKIFDRNVDLETAKRRRDQELVLWHDVWGVRSVFSKELVRRPALVMPLVLTAPSFGKNLPTDLPQDLQEATLKALAHLDKCDYGNDDLTWNHVGFYKEEGKEKGRWEYKAVLLDIKPVSRTDSSLQEMRRLLGFP